MGFDTLSLAMGGISEAKVEDFDALLVEAEEALEKYKLSDHNRSIIVQTLDRIKETSDYGVSPEMVEEIDNTIRDVALYVVNDDNSVVPVNITGTEDFSYTLTPSQWKLSRVEGCENLLGDLVKSVSRWSKQLREKTQDLWNNFNYNIEALSHSVKNIDQRLAEIEDESPTVDNVVIPKHICKMLDGAKNESIVSEKFDERVRNDILYLLTIVKVWSLESTEFKNRVIRFFGNNTRFKANFLKRPHPAFFSKKMYHDENVANLIYWSPQTRLIGNGNVTYSEYNGNMETFEDLKYQLGECGYGIIPAEKTNWFSNSYSDMNMSALSTQKLDKLYQSLTKIIEILVMLNGKNNSFTLHEKDVKDVLSSLEALKDEENTLPTEAIECFNAIAINYQENTFLMQTGLFRYLYGLASNIILYMSLHIEAYNGA